ncbi:Bcr/CflA family multidrug efflux MFS transporter [Rhodovarius crocodyli]|uniref:Bcr/CflA family efflux transporter n=1 Tax=Rhodovarius crocodyli TaxID=1979269 RepID=A0A437MP18_9PROT|nr:Bcr/CflA family multidrug efflux MFS transporter [Rhodovarius crocodyli]RVT99395.1 Bcr/CflA family multidrug efflux MFS transporter [Rhodovarius crocodyli]
MPSAITSDALAGATSRRRGNSDLRFMLVLAALMAFASISTDIYLPALPTLAVELNATPGQIQLTLSGFLIGFSLGQLFWGPVGDRFGRRVPVMIGLALFCLGSIGCALSGSAAEMIAWRVVQALGACCGPVLARAMVRDLYARERSAQMLSTLMLVMSVAPLLGPIVGGQIVHFWSWQGIFWLLAVLGVAVLFGVGSLRETLPPERRLMERPAAVIVTYILLLRDRRVLGYAVAGGFLYAGVYTFLAGSPFAYIEFYGISERAYGLLFGINIMGMMLANWLNTRLVPRFGTDGVLRAGAVIAGMAGVVMIITSYTGFGGIWGLIVPVFFHIAMLGFIVANSLAGALAGFPQRAGAVSALVGALHYGSGMVTTALIGWCADGTPWPMGLIIGACGIGVLVSVLALVRGK